MTDKIGFPGRKKLPVLLWAIAVVGGACGCAYLAIYLYGRYHYQAAEKALTRMALELAQKHLDKYLDVLHHHQDSGAQLLAARIARRRDDLSAFDLHMNVYEQINGATPASDLEKQLLEAQEGNLGQVEEILKRRLEREDSNELLIWEALGQGNVIAVHLPQAIQYLNQVLEKQPANYLAFYWRGRAWEAWNQFEKALDNYEKAVAIRPEFDRARQGYAGTLNRVG